jgi:hypothetical protein
MSVSYKICETRIEPNDSASTRESLVWPPRSRMIAMMREWGGRVALIGGAVAPFVPAAAEFVRRGVPDYLFTGDGATLELRTQLAAHGAQLLGPYSRFHWNHPGPMFFYLALPVYRAFHERGPSLNLFMLLVNAIVAVGIVLVARRLRGDPFAWLVAALLAILELVAMPFVQTGEWNPVAPLLPLVLLSFLAAAVARGLIELLPAFAFVASAIVQTHIGYAPEVAVLCAIAGAGSLSHGLYRHQFPSRPRRKAMWIAGYTCAVLIGCWSLPLYESATRRPGNLKLLVDFFWAPNPVEHTWAIVFTTVFQGLSLVPVAIAQSWRIVVPTPGPLVGEAIAFGELMLVGGALTAAWRRCDGTLAVLALIGLAEIVAAVSAVRAIRGDVLPYLVFWIAVPSMMAIVTGAAWLADEHGWGRNATIAVGVVALVLALAAPVTRAPVFRDRDAPAEHLARDVQAALAAHNVVRPVLRIGSDDVWPTAAAIILYLYKQRVPFLVDRAWVFMFGTPLAEDDQEHPSLLIGDQSFAERARAQPQLTRVGQSRDVFVFLEEAGFLRHHRMPSANLVSTTGIGGDAHVVVDGLIPIDGTPWNSPASVILPTSSSSVTVAVPRERVMGVFASVAGNDLYTLRCIGGPQLAWSIGVDQPQEGDVGMRTRLLFSDRIGECEAIQLAPVSGDGFYSVAEVGFLRK